MPHINLDQPRLTRQALARFFNRRPPDAPLPPRGKEEFTITCKDQKVGEIIYNGREVLIVSTLDNEVLRRIPCGKNLEDGMRVALAIFFQGKPRPKLSRKDFK